MPFHEEFDYMPLIRCRIGYHQVFLVSVGIGCRRLSHAQSIPKCQCWLTAVNGAWESVHFLERKQGDKAYEILWGWGLWQKGQIKRANCRGVWRHSSVELCRCLFQSMVWKGQGGDVRWRGRGGLTRNHFLLVKTVLYQDSGRFFRSVHVQSNYTSLFFSLSGHLYNGLRCRCMQCVTRMSPLTSMLGFSQSVTTWPLALALLWTRRASRGILPCQNWETIRMTYCVHHSSFLVLASSCFYPFNLKSPLESPLHVALSWSFRADWPTSHDMFCFVFSQGWKWYNKWDMGWQIYTECLTCCLNDTHIIIHITW